MLMMLALRLAESVIAAPARTRGVPRPGDRRERRKGNPADADDAHVAAR